VFCGRGLPPIAATNPHQAVLPIRRAIVPILACPLRQVKTTVMFHVKHLDIQLYEADEIGLNRRMGPFPNHGPLDQTSRSMSPPEVRPGPELRSSIPSQRRVHGHPHRGPSTQIQPFGRFVLFGIGDGHFPA
jgi:hypothetical protein